MFLKLRRLFMVIFTQYDIIEIPNYVKVLHPVRNMVSNLEVDPNECYESGIDPNMLTPEEYLEELGIGNRRCPFGLKSNCQYATGDDCSIGGACD